MKRMVFVFTGCAGLVITSAQAYGELITFPVVDQYDGTGSGNIVDRNASFYEGNSSGVGDNASLVLDVKSFREEISKAYTNGRGGVVCFDNAVIVGGNQTDSFAASFASNKTLVVKNSDHLRTDLSAPNIFVPVSGITTNGGFLAKSNVNGDQNTLGATFNFTFEEQGFGSNEHVEAVGGTILGRSGSVESARWLMKVTLDNGDIIAAIADVNFRAGNTRDDTFFGARAPKGRHITAVTWISLSGQHSALDSFAFITNGEPPKPKYNPQPDNVPAHAGDPSFFGIDYGGGSSGGSDSGSSGGTTLFGSERPSR